MSDSDTSSTYSRHRRTVFVVLPIYNEEARLGQLLDRIDEELYNASVKYRFVLVDDGSQDKTPRIIEERIERFPIELATHETNQGLGVTIRDGLQLAAKLAAPNDVIVTMDADDTHTPGLVLRMIRMISEGHDVVIASRYRPGSRVIGVPVFRRMLSYGASLLLRVLFPTSGVRDYTCGYRAYRASAIQAAIAQYGDDFLNQDGFQCMVDILLKLRRMDVIFAEVPFILRYDLKEGATKMRVGSTIRKTLALVFRRRLGG
ncbi:MAG: glycosyltransferase [Pirellulales bacterium]